VGTYQLNQFCLEPDAFFVREEGKEEFLPSKVLTRQTYTLDMVRARGVGWGWGGGRGDGGETGASLEVLSSKVLAHQTCTLDMVRVAQGGGGRGEAQAWGFGVRLGL
jgi:hypothetical protein